MDDMTRSEVAERAGVGRETVRYYEERGLIPEPRRSASGYRLYDESYVHYIRFIGRAKDLGFTLAEINELLELRIDPNTTCEAVKGHAEAKLEDVKEKVRDLRRIKNTLEELVAACSGEGSTSDCPILGAFETSKD